MLNDLKIKYKVEIKLTGMSDLKIQKLQEEKDKQEKLYEEKIEKMKIEFAEKELRYRNEIKDLKAKIVRLKEKMLEMSEHSSSQLIDIKNLSLDTYNLYERLEKQQESYERMKLIKDDQIQ